MWVKGPPEEQVLMEYTEQESRWFWSGGYYNEKKGKVRTLRIALRETVEQGARATNIAWITTVRSDNEWLKRSGLNTWTDDWWPWGLWPASAANTMDQLLRGRRKDTEGRSSGQITQSSQTHDDVPLNTVGVCKWCSHHWPQPQRQLQGAHPR